MSTLNEPIAKRIATLFRMLSRISTAKRSVRLRL